MNRSLLLLLAGGALIIGTALSVSSCAFIPLMTHSSSHLGFLPIFPVAIMGFSTLLHLGLAIWVGIDANRRGMSGFLWGVLVFLTSLVGLIVYLLVAQGQGGKTFRAPNGPGSAHVTATPGEGERQRCPSCGEPLDAEFRVCPSCGTRVACSECGRAMRGDWKVCPYCGWKKA